MSSPADEIQTMIERGDEALALDDIATARAHYLQAFRDVDHRRRSGVVARMGFLGHSHRKELLRIQQAIEALDQPPVFVGDGMATWMKSNSFVQRSDFLYIANKHAHLLPFANWHWNLHTIAWAVEQAADLPGDFVELGVFRGHTTAVIAEYVKFETWKRRWCLYDTFDGIPDDQLNPGWGAVNDATYRGDYSFEEVRDRFAAYPNIEVIKGRVPEILDEVCPEKIAFLHMD